MKINKIGFEAILILLSIFPIILLWYYWEKIPDVIATHFGFNGKADQWGKKQLLIWFIPLSNFLLYFLLLLIPNFDPKKKILSENHKYQIVRLILCLFMSALFSIYLISLMHTHQSFTFMLVPVFAVFLLIFGNYLQTLKANYFIGIRTPWALENEHNWVKTHRLGARLFMLYGVLILAGWLIPEFRSVVVRLFLPGLLFIMSIIIIYSYMIYKKISA